MYVWLPQSFMSMDKCQLFYVRYKDESKLINHKYNSKWEFQEFPYQKRFKRNGLGLLEVWSPSELLLTLSWFLKAVWKWGPTSARGDREDQAGEGKHIPLTLLSSPYLIISWAKSSVGLTRTKARTFFLVPILAKKKKIVQLSAVIIKWQLEGRCHVLRSEQSDLCSLCFPIPLRPSLLFCPFVCHCSTHRTHYSTSAGTSYSAGSFNIFHPWPSKREKYEAKRILPLVA